MFRNFSVRGNSCIESWKTCCCSTGRRERPPIGTDRQFRSPKEEIEQSSHIRRLASAVSPHSHWRLSLFGVRVRELLLDFPTSISRHSGLVIRDRIHRSLTNHHFRIQVYWKHR